MNLDEILVKLAEKLDDRYIIATLVIDTENIGSAFKTMITTKENGILVYECISPRNIGVNTFEQSRDLHFETVFLELIRKGLNK